ncbi:MAG: glycyl-radical enzyme activating protein [Promethearchaeota archaeon]|jgi:pyruvate formate lyase activating enzyme
MVQTKNAPVQKGFVYDLQRFAIHDGPGIRTLVYMKGCPLKCLWCSSPHTQKPKIEIMQNEIDCRKCGKCIEVCPVHVISVSEGDEIIIDRELCTSCGQCVETCPNQALKLVGYHITPEELFQEVNKDSPFYRRSNGGVTVGGGEPTMQLDFVTAFLKRCKQVYINTAIETCGYVKWDKMENLLKYVDLVYIDIKHMDPTIHKDLTGVSNELILENAKKISVIKPMIIRIPVIPGCNDSDDNITATARFAFSLGENLKRIDLLPYHKFGTQTYGRIGMKYKLADVEPPSEESMIRIKEIVESSGVKAQIGG